MRLSALAGHVAPAAIEQACARYVVDVSEVLAPPRPSQPRDVATARAEVWALLEDAGVTVPQIARLWQCPAPTVHSALGRRAKRGGT